jgi:hypothetical protein
MGWSLLALAQIAAGDGESLAPGCPPPPNLEDGRLRNRVGRGCWVPEPILSFLPQEALSKVFLAECKASIHSTSWHEAQDVGMLGRSQSSP